MSDSERLDTLNEVEGVNHEKDDIISEIICTSDTKYDHIFNQGYSFVILIACFLISFCSWGNNAAFSIYLAYYIKHDTYDGGTRLGYAALGGLTIGVGFILSPFINLIQGKFGLIKMLWLGNVLQTAGLVLTSVSSHHRIWQLYLCQGVLQSIGLVSLGLPSFTILPHWFRNDPSGRSIKHRLLSTSLGVFTSATGFGGLTYVLGMDKVIQVSGVRWGLRAQAIINFSLTTIAILLLRVKSSQKVQRQFKLIDVSLLKNYGFYMSIIFNCSALFGYSVCLYSMDSYTISLGYSSNQGAISAAMVLVGTAVCRPIVGIVSDNIGPVNCSIICYTLAAIFAFAMWIPARNYATVLVLCFILGALVGTLFITMVAIELRVIDFHLHRLGTFFAMGLLPFGVIGIVATLIAFSATKSEVSPVQFQNCEIIVGSVFLLSVVDLLIIRGYFITKDDLTSEGKLDEDEYIAMKIPVRIWLNNIFRLKHYKTL